MKKAHFIKTACAGIFMAAASTTAHAAAPVEGTCTATDKHYAPGMTVNVYGERNNARGTVTFTVSMGEFDDLFSRDGRTTAHFVTPADGFGKRIVVIDGIPATATESFTDESVTIEISSNAFDDLFAPGRGTVVQRNGWTCTLPLLHP
jgi:hypothetical protein